MDSNQVLKIDYFWITTNLTMKNFYATFTFLLIAVLSFGQTVNLNPSKDNSIYSDNANNSSGVGKLYSGQTCSSANRRALMQFDLSGIPAGSTITSVSLTVNVDNVSVGGGLDTYNLFPLTLGFGEGMSNGGGTGAAAIAPDATWNEAMFGSLTWTTAGGDFALISASSVIMNTSVGNKIFPNSANFVSLAQTWLDTPASNFGIIMIGNESTTCTARRFGSKDQGITPILTINYSAPPCSTPPTAICQNVNVYLDGSGNATILASDLDGGSVDNCGVSALSFAASQTVFNCADLSTPITPANSLIITGVVDGPLLGGTPKAVELFVAADIPDLSLYGLGSANNGGGTDGVEFTFPAVSVAAGQFLYLATDSIQFNAWFGFYPNYMSGSATNINGDDAIELFYNLSVVDVFGDINMSGTGQPWEYMDGWVYRNNFTGPDGSTFNLANWSFSGINALDFEITNAAAATPFPTAAYVPLSTGVSITLTVTDDDLLTDMCVATISVLDTISPTANALGGLSFECIGNVTPANISGVLGVADNCTVTPVVAHVGDNSDGASCPETITRTYSVTDDQGNSSSIIQLIVVQDTQSPVMAVAPATINVECSADVPGMLDLAYTDNCDASGVVTGTDVSDGLSCPETITRTWSYTDACGNSSVAVTQLIVVEDITPPAPDNNTLTTINGSCEVTPTTPTATDNCSGTISGVEDVTFPITFIGTTTVTWTYADACGNQSTQTQDVVVSAGIDISISQTDLTITAANTNATYQWIDCATNMPINGETSQSYTATVNGSYAVVLSEGTCSDTSVCTLINNVGIDNLKFESFSVYPNPAKDGIVTIMYAGELKAISVVDLMGRLIEVSTNLSNKSIDVSNLNSGKYIVRITSENDQTILGSIIVQK